MLKQHICFVCLTALALAFPALGAVASFHPIGFIGPPSQSIAYAVSADGSTVVGESISPDGFQAFRWTVSGGIVGLGALPNPGGFLSSQAFGVSGDGAVIVGQSLTPDALLEDGSAMRWSQADGMTYLGNLGGTDTGGICQGITPDASVIVGWCASSDGFYQPFRWTQAGGMQGLGVLPNEQIGRAQAVTADGNTIVGNISFGNTTSSTPFVWTAETGILPLASLSPGALGSGNAITPSGHVIVGQSAGRAVRWIDGVVYNLGEIQGGISSSSYWANAVSADGNRIVGMANFNAGQGTGEAFIWDPVHGMRSLKNTLLSDYGLRTIGWSLFDARGISADGRIIVGYGFDPQGRQEGWMVDLGVANCVGDLNGDGLTDLTDLSALLSAYGTNSGDPGYLASADLDHNGVIDLSDLAVMLGAYGCGA